MPNRKEEPLLPLGSDSKGYSKIASSKGCALADTADGAAGFTLLPRAHVAPVPLAVCHPGPLLLSSQLPPACSFPWN